MTPFAAVWVHCFCCRLKDVLTRLPAMTNQSDLTPLLPGHWKPARAS